MNQKIVLRKFGLQHRRGSEIPHKLYISPSSTPETFQALVLVPSAAPCGIATVIV